MNRSDVSGQRAALEAEVSARMGLVPNFFRPDQVAFEPVSGMWDFAKKAYLDNPLPALFKERLFVHLSRFCRARYCIVRHVGFLVGEGNVAGTPDVPAQSVDEVIKLLQYPVLPEEDGLSAIVARVEARPGAGAPLAGSGLERDVFALAALLFVEPLMAERARKALDTFLGSMLLERLLAFLAFVRTAHYWTLTHPSIRPEADMATFLDRHEALADLVLSDEAVAATETGQHLLEELRQLRAERDERAELRRALAERDEALERQELLIDELNHRVKNTLSVVQSMTELTLKQAHVSKDMRDGLTGRLGAIARAHDLLTQEYWGAVALDRVVRETLEPFRSCAVTIETAGPAVPLRAKTAVALAMALHELATNAAKYGALSVAGGRVEVVWSMDEYCVDHAKQFRFTWTEAGGPAVALPSRRGFGSMLIERSLSAELRGTAELRFEAAGLVCSIEAPLPQDTEAGAEVWGVAPADHGAARGGGDAGREGTD
ncbi:sensor histidine kinase [Amaricoccus macauensis]|uniref:sensor histidine kinase n=1 Tax=Amaricoccus macauensis TaxID=57001 RepID=UPI003C7D7FB8